VKRDKWSKFIRKGRSLALASALAAVVAILPGTGPVDVGQEPARVGRGRLARRREPHPGRSRLLIPSERTNGMPHARHMNRNRLLAFAMGTVVAVTVAGSVAYATIPGPGNVFAACMLKGIGTIRLIDKSLPQTNLLSHCTDKETEISWNQAGAPGPQGPAGAKGDPGEPGSKGADGTDGASVATAAEPSGANCAAGGVQLTSASGVSYVCNGRDGSAGSAASSTAFGSAAVIVGDPRVQVFADPAIGKIEVGCVAISGAPADQIAYTNTTATAKSIDMFSSPGRVVDPGEEVFFAPDRQTLIGPAVGTIPGANRGADPNSDAATRPFAVVDVRTRIPFPVTVTGVGGTLAGCLYTVSVTHSP
jgi:hypothetical protein